MDSTIDDQSADSQAVPVDIIRQRIDDLDGPVTTQQLVDHIAANGASNDEIATVAVLPEREWADYNQALAAASSGFRQRPEQPTDATVSDPNGRAQ